jgi:hypothetical protein
MKKKELLEKLDYCSRTFEDEGVKAFYVNLSAKLDECVLPPDKKNHCKEIIKKLSDGCRAHSEILQRLKTIVAGIDKDGF